MRKVLENCQPSKLKNIENALNLQHFKIPAPASISLLRKKLTIRRDWARQRGLGELNCRIRETCMTILDTITQTRTKMTRHWQQTRRRECNISKEEQDVLKHIRTLGNIRMNKLDKNLGKVVYYVGCETEAIKGHLESKTFTKLQTYEGQNMIEARQKLWDQTLQPAAGLFAEIELPEEMSKMLLQLVPHSQIRLSHMYVVWKIKAGATRPIVPSFTAPTALASKWIHEQLLPYVITIPTICMDSLAYTRELDNLILPVPWTGLIVCLDVVALYPSIPMKDSLQATMQFLKENTPLPNEAQLMIIKIMEWVIHNKYIEQENSIYHQIDGIVMGEALSVMVANIFMYKVVEETILHKWRDYILHYVRYVDDINTFMDITAAQAQDFKNDLTAQSEFINFTMDCYANKSDFLDLKITVIQEIWPLTRTRIDYRIYRKPGNTMAYLCADSYHASHTPYGIIIGELIRYLTKSSRREYYIQDAQMLYHAFKNRGYTHKMLIQGLGQLDWSKREFYRAKGLQPKIRHVPGGGAVFSTQIDPVMEMAIQEGFKLNLDWIRNTSTITADQEIKEKLGHNLTSIFPTHGMVALKAAPKLKGLVKRK